MKFFYYENLETYPIYIGNWVEYRVVVIDYISG